MHDLQELPPGDALSDTIMTLGIRDVRCSRFEASGDWSFSFPPQERLKFVATLRGHAWLLVPRCEPLMIEEGDVFLMGPTPYVVAARPELAPATGAPLYQQSSVARVGSEVPATTVGVGGSVAFASSGAEFLYEALPIFFVIRRGEPAAKAIVRTLELLEAEMDSARAGSRLIATRLAEVLLVEGIRSGVIERGGAPRGWIGALSDRRIAAALALLHAQMARNWTLDDLSTAVGMSRSAFALQFKQRVGRAPLDYLRYWRMMKARSSLASGRVSIAALAEGLGYNSQAAFTQAFRRQFGCTPTAYRPPGRKAHAADQPREHPPLSAPVPP